jgi:hypothetical protein
MSACQTGPWTLRLPKEYHDEFIGIRFEDKASYRWNATVSELPWSSNIEIMWGAWGSGWSALATEPTGRAAAGGVSRRVNNYLVPYKGSIDPNRRERRSVTTA